MFTLTTDNLYVNEDEPEKGYSYTTHNLSGNLISVENFNNWINKHIPRFSRITEAKLYLKCKQDLSGSTGDLVIGFYDSDKNFVKTFFDVQHCVTTSAEEIEADFKDYLHSENSQAGNVSLENATHFSFSFHADFLRTWTVYYFRLKLVVAEPYVNLKTIATTGGIVSNSYNDKLDGAAIPVKINDKTITITATPNPGFKFVKWEDSDGNSYTSASLDIAISQNNISAFTTYKTYTAYFEPNNILVGTSHPSKVYVDSREVKEIYVGTTKIY